METPPLADSFEPEAKEALREEPSLEAVEVAAISLAISVKRIADALCLDSNFAGFENLAHQMGMAFQSGMNRNK